MRSHLVACSARPRVLAVILAGGEGRRLAPLTATRSKAALPVGGRYRLIDFALSNLVNSGLLRIKVLTNPQSDSLHRYLLRGWGLPGMLDLYVEAVPTPQRGSAEALHRALPQILNARPDVVAIFAADHICKMDVGQMIDTHLRQEADVTLATARAPGSGDGESQARLLGCCVFSTPALLRELDRAARHGAFDLFRHVLPALAGQPGVALHDLSTNEIPGEQPGGYWRDVNSVGAFWRAHMDLVEVTPPLNLYNSRWPIHTFSPEALPPAKFVYGDDERTGMATDSLVSEGVVLAGGRIHRSVLGPGVRVESHAHVEESVLFAGVEVGPRARVRRAIVDKGVRVPAGAVIGHDRGDDARRFHLSPEGLVVVARGSVAPPAYAEPHLEAHSP